MSFNFSNFKTADITGKTAEWVIPGAIGCPVLILAPAVPENTEFQNAFMEEFSSAEIQAIARAKKLDNKKRAAMAAGLRRIFPRALVKGWRNVPNVDGELVPFSEDAAAALFHGDFLQDWIVNEAFAFASERANFFDSPPATESLAGNSQAA